MHRAIRAVAPVVALVVGAPLAAACAGDSGGCGRARDLNPTQLRRVLPDEQIDVVADPSTGATVGSFFGRPKNSVPQSPSDMGDEFTVVAKKECGETTWDKLRGLTGGPLTGGPSTLEGYAPDPTVGAKSTVEF